MFRWGQERCFFSRTGFISGHFSCLYEHRDPTRPEVAEMPTNSSKMHLRTILLVFTMLILVLEKSGKMLSQSGIESIVGRASSSRQDLSFELQVLYYGVL